MHLNKLGHKFIERRNGSMFRTVVYYICENCKISVYMWNNCLYSDENSLINFGKLTITCDEMIIKNIIE